MNPKDLSGSAPRGSIGTRNGDGLITRPGRTIFPIIRQDSDGRYHLIGTGFFISDNGLFVTAKHVLMDVINDEGNQTAPISLVQFLESETFILRPILRVTHHEIADISVGVPAPIKSNRTGLDFKNTLLRLSLNVPERGARICTYAYPKTVIVHAPQEQYHYHADFFAGELQEIFPEKRDSVLMPWPCAQTSMNIHGGASGGPIFGPEGNVFAVNSKSYDGDPSLSYVTLIHLIQNLIITGVFTPNNSSGNVTVRELADANFITFDSAP